MTPDAEFPATPYPGARPPFSYVHIDGQSHRLTPSWYVDGLELDDWLADAKAPGLSERVPVLTYGSNANPSKITWLRENLGLGGPVPVLRATCTDLAAVWASGLRVVDTQRPVTLTSMPGNVETHAVWMADARQVRVLDVCEGRGNRYHLSRLEVGRVELEDGAVWDRVLAYTGAGEIRWPLLANGQPVRALDISQVEAQGLVGEPGPPDLKVSVVEGEPSPEDFPGRVFVYGTLKPGASAWELAEPWVEGDPYPGHVRGTMFDTGFGYPGLLPGDGTVSGWVLPLRPGALPTLDAYEGEEYRRVRISLSDGQICWTYRWIA